MSHNGNAAGAPTPTASNELLNSDAIVAPADAVDQDHDADGIAADDYIRPGGFYGALPRSRRVILAEQSRYDVDALRRTGKDALGIPFWEQDITEVVKLVEGKTVDLLVRPSRVDAGRRYAAALDAHARGPKWVRVCLLPEDTDIATELDAGRGLKDVGGRTIIRGPEMETGQHVVNNALDRLVEASLDRRALAELPPPEPLIEGLLYRDSLARLVGAPGSFKTYLKLDMVLCIDTGRDWHGRPTIKGGGKELLLIGEGLAGINDRIAAWEAEFNNGEQVGFDEDGEQTLWILPVPMNLASNDPEVLALIELAAGERFDLIVVDTQSRFTPGVEENSAADLGVLVETLDALRRASGACVSVVHHSGHSGTHGRGSTVMLGALETELHLSRGEGNVLTMRCAKQKNTAEADDITFTVHPVGDNVVLHTLDEVGGAAGLDYQGYLQAPLEPRGRRDKSPNYEKIARFIWETYQGGSGATKADIKAALKAATWGTEPDTEIRLSGAASSYRQRFDESWTKLENRKWIAKVGGRERFLLSTAGADELGFSDEADTAGEIAAND